MKSRKAITLIELVMAISLMGLVILIAANIEIAVRKFFSASDKQGRLQVKLSAAMEHMVKNISLTHGDKNNSGFSIALPMDDKIVFRRDQPIGGVYTPEQYSDDVWMAYWRQGNQVIFCADFQGSACAVSEKVICYNVDNLNLQFIPRYFSPQDLYVEIVFTGSDVDVAPVRLHTLVFPRSYSAN